MLKSFCRFAECLNTRPTMSPFAVSQRPTGSEVSDDTCAGTVAPTTRREASAPDVIGSSALSPDAGFPRARRTSSARILATSSSVCANCPRLAASPALSTCCQSCPADHTAQCRERNRCQNRCGRLLNAPHRTCCQACPTRHTRQCRSRQFELSRNCYEGSGDDNSRGRSRSFPRGEITVDHTIEMVRQGRLQPSQVRAILDACVKHLYVCASDN